MKTPSIACVGGGNMATSLLTGLKNKGFTSNQLCVSEPSKTRREFLAGMGFSTFSSNAEAVGNADLVIIAVKPQVVRPVLEDLKGIISQSTLVLSIAAGIPLSALSSWLGEEHRIIRCMPNTPALKGVGISGLYTNSTLSTDETSLINTVLGAVGKTVWLDAESQLDAVTAISGSGPAYFFYLTECLIQAARELGLSESTSKLLATETAYGSAVMLRDPEVDAGTLRRNVTSPGGTTEAALAYLIDTRFSELFKQAVHAASARSMALGESVSGNKD